MTNSKSLYVERLSCAAELAALGEAWNALARGVPFRSFAWLESWWRVYGARPGQELFVLSVRDAGGDLLAIAPWYAQRTASGQVVRFLGSGEVCSDYLSVLCQRGSEQPATQALAEWLAETSDDDSAQPSWSRLELGGIDEQDAVIGQLLADLHDRGKLITRSRRASCWRVHLPTDWEAYLAMLSKSHRKQVRRLERRYFDSGRARLRIAASPAEVEHGLSLLATLHRRRRESLGERGRFDCERFHDFHRQTTPQLLAGRALRLAWLELDGQPVAAEYQVLGEDVVYAYQSGIEPSALEHEPGRLITLATLKLAIAERRRAFDFLRGDEEYKAHWRAVPRPAHDVCVMADSAAARLRHQLWVAGGNVRRWVKRTLQITGTVRR